VTGDMHGGRESQRGDGLPRSADSGVMRRPSPSGVWSIQIEAAVGLVAAAAAGAGCQARRVAAADRCDGRRPGP